MEQTMSILEKTETGLVTTLLGMGMLFVVLIVLIFVVSLLKSAFHKNSEPVSLPQIVETTAQEPTVPAAEDDLQLVAVITAALAAYLGHEVASTMKVNSIRRVNALGSSWVTTARQETIAARQELYR